MGEKVKKKAYLCAMKHSISLLALTLALFCTVGCQQRKTLPSPQEEVLYEVECFYARRPDSALQILDTLDIEALSQKERAHFCLLKAQSISLIDFTDPEADSLLQVAEDYFSSHDEKYFEALTYYARSRIAGLDGSDEKTVTEFALRTLHCIEACQNVDERLLRCSNDDEQTIIGTVRSQIQMNLSAFYASTGFVEESIHYAKLADQFYAEHDNARGQIRAAFLLGDNYLGLEEYDSCLMYIEKGRQIAEAAHDTVEGAYYYVVANLYYMTQFDNEEYDSEAERLQLLHNAVATSRKGLEVLENKTGTSAIAFQSLLNHSLCSGYYELQQYDSSIYFGHQTEALLSHDLVKTETYRYLLQSYLAQGDVDNAQHYADLFFERIQEFDFVGKEVAEVNDEYEKNLALRRLHDEQQLKRMRLYLLVATLAVVLLLVTFLAYRQHKEKQMETLRLNEEKLRLQRNYDDKERLSNEALRMRMQNIYREQNDNVYSRLLNEFNAVYPNALAELKNKRPELTETEQAICLLSFFSFRVKEIAYILDLKENTVSKSRLNIKRKTGLDDFAEVVRPFIG